MVENNVSNNKNSFSLKNKVLNKIDEIKLDYESRISQLQEENYKLKRVEENETLFEFTIETTL